MVERHGIAYHEKAAGQLFCDGSAREIVALLEDECAAAGVRIETGREVRSVRKCGRIRSGGRSRFVAGRIAGNRHRRTLGAENRRDAVRLFRGGAIRIAPGGVPARAGAADVPPRGPGEIRHRWPGVSAEVGGARRRALVPREDAFHASRTERTGGAASVAPIGSQGKRSKSTCLPGVDLAVLDGAAARRRATARKRGRLLAEWLPKRLADRWFEVHGESKPLAATRRSRDRPNRRRVALAGE